MITVTINGQPIRLDKPMTALEAAQKAGFHIPTLCHHKLLLPEGNCRMCLIDVENFPRLQTACTLRIADGMVIYTETDEIIRARRGILEFLMINHPLDCPVCDKAGECNLQDLVKLYGAEKGRFTEEKRFIDEHCKDPVIARYMKRCILCTRCFRMCESVQGAYALTLVGRGGNTRIEPFSSERFNCEYCGNCITACPVGSILSRLHIHAYRPWQITEEVDTVCGYCGVGCSFCIQIREELINRIKPKTGLGINNGLLCAKGSFGYDYVHHADRLRKPMIRKNDRLWKVSWDEALDYIADRLAEIKKQYGAQSIGGIASPRCTNEANYLFQKFMRTVIGTNNIDSVARLDMAGALKLLEGWLGTGSTVNVIEDIKKTDTIFVFGGDPTVINPILGLQIRAASMKGSNLFTLGCCEGLRRFSILEVNTPLYEEEAFLEQLVVFIYREKGLKQKDSAIEGWIKKKEASFQNHKPVTIPDSSFYQLLEFLWKGKSFAITLGPDLLQRSNGYKLIRAVAAITYLLDAKLYLLSEKPNTLGLMEMGCLPDALPGYAPIINETVRRHIEKHWDTPIPEDKGLTLMEMMEESAQGSLKALYVMGENPAFNLPDTLKMQKALKNLKLLVVQDIFLTETAELANVVLPAMSWAEEEGTFTNLERRIQKVRKVVKGRGWEDWRIVTELAKRMNYEINYDSSNDIMDEISSVSLLHKGLKISKIGSGGILWPYLGEPAEWKAEEPPSVKKPKTFFHEGIIHLGVFRNLFHSGSMSRKASTLCKISPAPALKVATSIYNEYTFHQGDQARVSSPLSSVTATVEEAPFLPENMVLLSNHFRDCNVYRLLGYTLDPVTKAPGTEGWKVTLQKIVQ